MDKLPAQYQRLLTILESKDAPSEKQRLLNDYALKIFEEKIATLLESQGKGIPQYKVTSPINDKVYDIRLKEAFGSEPVNLSKVLKNTPKNYFLALYHNFVLTYLKWQKSKIFPSLYKDYFALSNLRNVYWCFFAVFNTLNQRDQTGVVSVTNLADNISRTLLTVQGREHWINKYGKVNWAQQRECKKEFILLGTTLINVFREAILDKEDNIFYFEKKPSGEEFLHFNYQLFADLVDHDPSLLGIKTATLFRVEPPEDWPLDATSNTYYDEVLQCAQQEKGAAPQFAYKKPFIKPNLNLEVISQDKEGQAQLVSAVNRLQKTAYKIKREVVEIYLALLNSETEISPILVTAKAVKDAQRELNLARKLFHEQKIIQAYFENLEDIRKHHTNAFVDLQCVGEKGAPLQVLEKLKQSLVSSETTFAEAKTKLEDLKKEFMRAYETNKAKLVSLNLQYKSLEQQHLYQRHVLTSLWLFSHVSGVYYPWNLDSRFRAYPMSSINHQQGEFIRSCFAFKETEELKEEAHPESFQAFIEVGADLFGPIGKVLDSNLKREWFNLHRNKIENYPQFLFWVWTAKKPGYFLAWCNAMVQILKTHATDYITWIDASSNAYQHMNAFVRDSKFASLLNMTAQVPTENFTLTLDITKDPISTVRRTSFYDYFLGCIESNCVLRIKALEVKDKDSLRAKRLKQFLHEGHLTRSLIKRTVMSFIYGVTAEGMKEQLEDELKAHTTPLMEEDILYFAKFVIKATLEKELPTFALFFRLLQIAAQRGKNNKTMQNKIDPLYWEVPVFKHKIMLHNFELIKAKLDNIILGRRMRNTYYYEVDTYDKDLREALPARSPLAASSRGIAPNFVHNLDAVNLLLVINKADFPVTSIHDSVGIHISKVPFIKKIYKQIFFEIHKEDPYKNFFLRQNLMYVPVIKGLKDTSVLSSGLKKFIVERNNELYYDAEQLLKQTRGSLNLEELLEAPFFIA